MEYSLLQVSFVFVFFLFFIIYISFLIGVDYKFSLVLYFWHSIFSLVYAFFIMSAMHGDAMTYYYNTRDYDLSYISVGTQFVVFFTNIFRWLGFDFFSTSLVFNFIGSVGLILFYKVLSDLNVKDRIYKILLLFFLFLPSLSFWSSGIGKDAISFLSVMMFLYGYLYKSKLSMIISIFIMFMVRPHIAALMIFSYALDVVVSKKMPFLNRFIVFLLLFSVTFLSIYFVESYIGIKILSSNGLENLSVYFDERENLNTDGGGGVDLRSMSVLEKFFTYMFRPLPYEAFSITSLLSSIENSFLLLLFLYSLCLFLLNHAYRVNGLFIYVYIVITLAILSMTTANLGIAVRQKWMIYPFVIYIWMYSYSQYLTKRRGL